MGKLKALMNLGLIISILKDLWEVYRTWEDAWKDKTLTDAEMKEILDELLVPVMRIKALFN